MRSSRVRRGKTELWAEDAIKFATKRLSLNQTFQNDNSVYTTINEDLNLVNERTVGEYVSGENSATNAGWYMELKDLEREIEAVAIKELTGTSADELTFKIGAKVQIIRKESDLWKGRCDGKVGWFPSDFVAEVDPDNSSEMKYTTIDLAVCATQFTQSDRPFAFRITQNATPWKMESLVVSGETKEETDDWMATINVLSQNLHNKISLLRTKEKQFRIANELSSLVVYCQAVPFDFDFALKDPRTTFYEMCSFSETKHDKLLERNLTLFNSRQLSRVYPQASRLTSTNLNPVGPWCSGCHMVAMNYQTGDRPMQINNAKFMANGRCGYVLKPNYLMDETFRPDLANDCPRAGAFPIVLTVQVIAGKHLSRKDHNKGICSPLVEVEVLGVATDCIAYKTESITSNGLNPRWNETFVFQVCRPELALLRFMVEDGDFVGPKTDPFIGQAGFPVDCIRPGYRSVPLLNQFSEPFEVSSLLVHVEIKPLVEDNLSTTPLTPWEAHLKLQAGRTTVEKFGDKLDREDNSQSSADASAIFRPIPRLSLDYKGDDNSTGLLPATSKPGDRKISLTQSTESYSPTNLSSNASFPSFPLAAIDSRSASVDSTTEDVASLPAGTTTKKTAFKKFFRFGK